MFKYLLLLFSIIIIDTVNYDYFSLNDSEFKIGQIYTPDSKILFEFNQPTITEESFETLNKIASFLIKNNKLIIEIGVHNDSRSNPYSSNNLGYRRAIKIKEYLIEKGVDDNRLKSLSYGNEKPQSILLINENNDTSTVILTESHINQFKDSDKTKYEELHSFNRRVEFKIIQILD